MTFWYWSSGIASVSGIMLALTECTALSPSISRFSSSGRPSQAAQVLANSVWPPLADTLRAESIVAKGGGASIGIPSMCQK